MSDDERALVERIAERMEWRAATIADHARKRIADVTVMVDRMINIELAANAIEKDVEQLRRLVGDSRVGDFRRTQRECPSCTNDKPWPYARGVPIP